MKWISQKVLNMQPPTPNLGLIVTFSQFYLKLNNLFVR